MDGSEQVKKLLTIKTNKTNLNLDSKLLQLVQVEELPLPITHSPLRSNLNMTMTLFTLPIATLTLTVIVKNTLIVFVPSKIKRK